jgi:hypothetical protein
MCWLQSRQGSGECGNKECMAASPQHMSVHRLQLQPLNGSLDAKLSISGHQPCLQLKTHPSLRCPYLTRHQAACVDGLALCKQVRVLASCCLCRVQELQGCAGW